MIFKTRWNDSKKMVYGYMKFNRMIVKILHWHVKFNEMIVKMVIKILRNANQFILDKHTLKER